MRPGAQQGLVALSEGPAQPQDDGLLLRANGEKAGGQEDHHQENHHKLDDGEAAAEGLGKGLQSSVHRHLRRRRGRRRLAVGEKRFVHNFEVRCEGVIGSG